MQAAAAASGMRSAPGMPPTCTPSSAPVVNPSASSSWPMCMRFFSGSSARGRQRRSGRSCRPPPGCHTKMMIEIVRATRPTVTLCRFLAAAIAAGLATTAMAALQAAAAAAG